MLNFKRDDTIAALSTAPGTGAIAVIRLSGKSAFTIGDRVFRAKSRSIKSLQDQPGYSLHFGEFHFDDTVLDEVLVAVFRGPHSYTGEDTLEFSCHGSPFIQQQLLQALCQQGARLAEPGEYTLRAFLNGKLDLSQAEAVADLIASGSAAAHRVALQQMRGGFSRKIKDLRAELIHFASLIELELDFSEEDVEFANREQLRGLVKRLCGQLDALIRSFELGNVLRNGIPVVIAGKPNVGKSTLLNTLLREERAIVSDIAGTTRDTIEEELSLQGIRFRFIDTAGIRDTSDTIERIGVERTLDKIRQSPLLLYLFDVTETTAGSLQLELEALRKLTGSDTFRLLLVGNKSDGSKPEALEKEFKHYPEVIFLSAKSGAGLSALEDRLLSAVDTERLQSGDTIVSNARHALALQQTEAALERVLAGLDSGVTHDFIASDLRVALHHLGEITGEISTDDLLENIFSKFCIGK
ncbi:MAG: tRNA uridine-5-carboxymethylaminomethyl(34) synthesis GTPase MnmE [Bacteroidota bacterium]